MGVRVPREVDDQPALAVLDKAGLKDEIMQMQKLSLKDPAQSVEAQEKLDQLLPKMNKAFEDAGFESHKLTQLSYKDPNSGDTIKTDLGQSGGAASLNTVINAFAKQDAPSVPAPKQQAAPAAPGLN
jgi:hypothetical protein